MSDAVLPAKKRAIGWLFDLFTHHQAEAMRTNRAIARKAMGIDMEDLPYPGSSITTVVNQAPPAAAPTPPAVAPTPPASTPAVPAVPPAATPPPASGTPAWAVALLTAAGLTVGGGAVGVGTGVIPIKPPTAVVQPVAPQIVQPTAVVPGQETVTWISTDGGQTWKQVPLTPQP